MTSYNPSSGFPWPTRFINSSVPTAVGSREEFTAVTLGAGYRADLWSWSIRLEGRYDLTPKWDLGLHGSVLHSWNAGRLDCRSGLSLSRTLVKNLWVGLGYNFSGFRDSDFSGADFTAAGPYVKFRVKFDQQSVRELVDRNDLP